jgi:hypothetical protein
MQETLQQAMQHNVARHNVARHNRYGALQEHCLFVVRFEKTAHTAL